MCESLPSAWCMNISLIFKMWHFRDTAVVQRRKPSWDIIALLLKKGNQSFEVVSDYFYPTSKQCLSPWQPWPDRSIPVFLHICAVFHEEGFLERNTCFFAVFAFQHGLKLSYHKEIPETLRCEGNRRREPDLFALGMCTNLPKAIHLPSSLVLLPAAHSNFKMIPNH